MRPIKQNYILKEKKELTKNIFKLVFEAENELNIIPGQFITFLIPKIWARAYSVLEKDGKNIKFIIEKIELENWWRWWSKFLCEAEISEELQWIWASGRFILQENNKNKLFLWTWTGFVPLYFMIKSALLSDFSGEIKFLFWVRTFSDVFYLEELEKLKEKHKNFSFEIYLSREEKKWFKNWYITKFIDENTKDNFKEAYICWNPNMVDDVKKKLIENSFDENMIFEEKY